MAVTREPTTGTPSIRVFHVMSSFLWTDMRTLSVSIEEIRGVSQMGRKEIDKKTFVK